MIDEYVEIPQEAVAGSKILSDFYIRLGRPQDPFSESGKKMMTLIISIWEDLYPVEMRQWYEERKDYKANEISMTEQVRKHTGRSLASIPMPIYQIMKKIFPDFDATERNNCMKLVAEWPMFRMCERV